MKLPFKNNIKTTLLRVKTSKILLKTRTFNPKSLTRSTLAPQLQSTNLLIPLTARLRIAL